MKKNYEKSNWSFVYLNAILSLGVVDPGFPHGGGTNPRGEGAPTYDFAKKSQKLHEVGRILTRRGGASKNVTM